MFSVERSNGTTIVYVSGDLDIASSPRLANVLTLALGTAAKRIIVSLEECTFCDASGLSVFVRVREVMRDLVVVVPPRAPCRPIFDMMNLCKRLHVVPSMEDALLAKLSIAV